MANILPILPQAQEPAAVPDGGDIGPVQSGWRLALREFAQNKLAVTGIAVLVFFVLFCFVGPVFYHGDILVSNLLNTNAPPQAGNPLGTNDQGFDELADIFLSVPFLFVVLIVAVRFGASVLSLSLIIGGFTWLVPARLVRGEVLSLRVRDFVAAARVAGSGRGRLIGKHLIPNAMGVMIVNVTFQVADAILAIAALGFLGFGLHYPTQDWGDMLSNGVQYMQDGYWWQIYPVGACIVLVVMACNLVGDALRDSLDVRLRRR
jgi:peptide/nickel transport system permease protein